MSSIEFTDAAVIKRGPPDLMRVEAEKMSRAALIGRETGLFRVPELLEYSDEAGVLTIERIPGLIGIRRAPLDAAALLEFVARTGASLAAVHRDLRLPSYMDRPLDAPWAGAVRLSYIHGDFSVENVCVDPAHPELPVVIDWQTTQRHGGIATFDSAYFDIAWFINNWFYKPVYRLRPRREYGVARVFLEEYANAAGTFDRREFGVYHREFFEKKMKARRTSMSLLKRAIFSRGNALWDTFIQEGGT